MGEMAMPGGWTNVDGMMRMPGQSWPGAAVAFLGMWVPSRRISSRRLRALALTRFCASRVSD